MKTRLSEDGTKLVGSFEMHPYHFDRTGILQHWTTTRLCEYVVHMSNTLYIPGYMETVATYARYKEFYFHPAFYSSIKLNSTVEAGIGVGYVGKTSFILNGDGRLVGSEDVLFHFMAHLVHVDISTRRPAEIPKNLQLKRKGLRPKFSLPMPPSTSMSMYSHKFRVEESDLDANGHTNQSVFIRSYFDTAAFGSKGGSYPSLKKDLLKYPVKKVAVLYQKEAFLGDVLEVQSWEIPSKPASLGFQVKRGEDDIVQCLFEFYEERAKL